MAAGFVGGIISILMGIVMIASVFMPVVKDTNTSTWSTSEVSIWGLVGLIGILGIVYGVANVFGLV